MDVTLLQLSLALDGLLLLWLLYGPREEVPDAAYSYVRTEKALDSLVASHPGVRLLFAATFLRDRRINYPTFYRATR